MNINTNPISLTTTVNVDLDLSSLYDNNMNYSTNISTTTDPVTFTVDPDLIKSWATNSVTNISTK